MQFELLKDHEGVLIVGNADDFRAFHELIHDVNERSPIIHDREGLFLALAYDFRKAFEGQLHVRRPKGRDTLEGTKLGFDILWPTLLIQCRMYRESLGFIDTSKWHQALAYSLEGIVGDGLKFDFPSQNLEIQRAYRALDPAHPYLDAKASSRLEHWYNWNKKSRETRFVELLESLDPMFETSFEFYAQKKKARRMSPAEWDAIDSEIEINTRRH